MIDLEEKRPPREVLLRGLSVLAAMNHRVVSTVEQLAHTTRLPKSTVVRVLSVLAQGEFVQRLPNRKGYVLEERVLTLSSGFKSQDSIVRYAKPFLSEFTASHRWPLSLATLDGDTMRVRSSTLQESLYATDIDMRRLARRLPLLSSALGLAYLSFCPNDERTMLLTLLKTSKRKMDQPLIDGLLIARTIKHVRKVGYAVSPVEPDNSAVGIAVPIMEGDRVLACLSMRYLGRTMSDRDAASRYLLDLQATAKAIASVARLPRDRL